MTAYLMNGSLVERDVPHVKPPKERKLFPAQPDGDLQPTPEIHSTGEASTIESFLKQVEGRLMAMIESVVMKAFESFHLSLHDEMLSLRARLEKFEKEVNTKWEVYTPTIPKWGN